MNLTNQETADFLSTKLKPKRYQLCYDFITKEEYFIFSKKGSKLEKNKTNFNFNRWKKVFDLYYSKIIGNPDSTSDTSVWIDSETHNPIPESEMNEWLDLTVSKISKYLKPNSRVLEIGCGNGLILQKIIHLTGEYIGIENSQSAIESIKNSSVWKKNKDKIKLYTLSAIDINELTHTNFDFIIINSVIQYFPNLEYFIDMLSQLESKLKESSYIYIGDIRCYEMSDLQYLEKSQYITNLNDRNKIICFFRQRERETLYSQEFFKSLSKIFPWISTSIISKKLGKFENEMSKYRFDLLIYCKQKNNIGNNCSSEPISLCWVKDKMDSSKIDAILSELSNNRMLIIDNCPNDKLEKLKKAYNRYFTESSFRSKTINNVNIQSINNICEKNNIYLEILTSVNPLFITLRFAKCPIGLNKNHGLNFTNSILNYSNNITGLVQQNFEKEIPSFSKHNKIIIKQVDDKIFDLQGQ